MKTKIATSIEQSKKLLELGLDAETADMCYTNYKFQTDDTGNLIDGTCKPIGGLTIGNPLGDFPAWSLSALLDLMPSIVLDGDDKETTPVLGKDKNKYYCSYECEWRVIEKRDKNPLDACYEVIIELVEQGYIKTEKK